MSDASYLDGAEAARSVPQLPVAAPSDYFQLLKPRVMSLVVLTALAGILIAPVPPHPLVAFAALLSIAVGAGASGALNMWYDADIDAVMTRTARRPIPAGRMEPESALAFGLVLSMLSVFTLGFATNWLAASLLAFTIFFYVVIYTMWLKRSTPQNIVIGGAAGALPPIVGYAAATGDISLASIVLFAVIFVWTPPHFWALALVKHDDYSRAGVPMMPNALGADRTRLEILVYSLVLAPLGAVPWALGFAGAVYGAVAIAAGLYLAWLAVQVYRRREGDIARRAAMKLFFFSISYLFLLFLIIVGERLLTIAGII
ncbi:heme o synthase [Methylocystis iwaonis]|uniref:Protoheme IX farnesyltransferase n=1 Tax=Methylocystis iwaonis TaxID=2885079 RepID=A0ABM8E5M6_9HYPH|nr:heme o synthase [Methylocystis iwaonis]BDV33273.1 protoheme IX farnesyltransferase [Methylocystis iwaonis]